MENNKEHNFLNKHRTEWQDFLWNKLLDQATDLKSNSNFRRSFNVLFSNYEKRIITQRIAILELLRKGKGTREISRLLYVSTTIVSNIKKNFFGNPGVYRSPRAFKKINKGLSSPMKIKDRSWLDVFSDIDILELIKNPPRPRGIGFKN